MGMRGVLCSVYCEDSAYSAQEYAQDHGPHSDFEHQVGDFSQDEMGWNHDNHGEQEHCPCEGQDAHTPESCVTHLE